MLDILSPPFHSHTFLCPVLSARERAPWTAASGLLTSCSLLDFGQKEALARLSVSSESYWDHNWYNDGAQPLPSNSHSCWGFGWQRGRGGRFLGCILWEKVTLKSILQSRALFQALAGNLSPKLWVSGFAVH